MLFLFDPIPPASIEAMAQALLAPPPPHQSWLLVDGALVEPQHLQPALRFLGWASHHALEFTPLVAYGERGLLLVALPQEAEKLTSGLQRLIGTAPSAPAWSCFASTQPLPVLQQCFAYLAQAQHDLLKVHCRVADIRVLPVLLAQLSDAQRQRITTSITHWHWFHREEGGLQTWKAPSPMHEAVDPLPHLQINDSQFAAMLDAAEPDGIFLQLQEVLPALVPKQHRGRFYSSLLRILQTATQLQLQGNPDRLQFVVLSLGFGEHFHKHPQLQDTWKAVQQGQSFTALKNAWSDALWDTLEQKKS